MSEKQTGEHVLPPGTYYLTAMLVGGDNVKGQSVRLYQPSSMTLNQLAFTAQKNAPNLVPDDAAGAQPGMWWVFQTMVFDAWGRAAIMTEQAGIDRTLDRDELAGEIAQASPQAFLTIGKGLAKALVPLDPLKPDTAWPSSTARH